jgi:hypothetical protein
MDKAAGPMLRTKRLPIHAPPMTAIRWVSRYRAACLEACLRPAPRRTRLDVGIEPWLASSPPALGQTPVRPLTGLIASSSRDAEAEPAAFAGDVTGRCMADSNLPGAFRPASGSLSSSGILGIFSRSAQQAHRCSTAAGLP